MDDPTPAPLPENSIDIPIDISDVTPHSVVISGNFVEGGDSSTVCGVRLSLQNTKFLAETGDNHRALRRDDGSYVVEINDLYSDTTYFFCTYYLENNKQVCSDTYNFRTHRLEITTDSVTRVYAYGAQFNHTLSEPVDLKHFHGTYGMLYSKRPRALWEFSSRCDSSLYVKSLAPGTTYYYRAYVLMRTANLQDVFVYGQTLEFTTPDIGVVTDEPQDVEVFSATLSGYVNVYFDDTVDYGFLLFTRNRDVTLDSVGAPSDQQIKRLRPNNSDPMGYGAFSVDNFLFESSTTYYYRAYMKKYVQVGNARRLETFYGDVVSFRTGSLVISDDEWVDLGLSVKWAGANMGASAPSDLGVQVSHDGASAAIGANIGRLPTLDEAQELVDKCIWNWMRYRHVDGVSITGPSGRSIFVPANMLSGKDYTWGAYLIDAAVSRGYVPTLRFVKDVSHDNQSSKTADNAAATHVELGVRLVQ